MSEVTPQDVRTFVAAYLEQKLATEGRDETFELNDSSDLLLSGVVDSLGFLELITSIQENYGSEIDFEDLDSESMSIVGPLCDFVAARLTRP